MRILAPVPALAFLGTLASCSYIEPVFVTNNSVSTIEVFANDVGHTIAPGKTRKIRGFHLANPAVAMSSGERVSYSVALADLFDNRADYIDRYICPSFFGSRVDVHYSATGRLQLMPCNSDYPVIEMTPDA